MKDGRIRILITHVFGYVNKGDWMLLDALVSSLQAVFPNAELLGICRDPVSQSQYFPQIHWSVQYGTSSKSGWRRRADNIVGLLHGLWRNVAATRMWLGRLTVAPAECFRKLDLVVACPGGYLEDSNPSIMSNLAHLWMALDTGAPVILAPQSIGPFKSGFWLRRTAQLLRRTHRVIVREQQSESVVRKEMGLPDHLVRCLPDMAYYDNRPDFAAADGVLAQLGLQPKQFAAATVIDWYFPNSKLPERSKRSYLTNIAKLASYLQSEHGLATLVLKQVEAGYGTPGDERAMRELRELAPTAVRIDETNHSPAVMRGIIGRAAVFIGSRMHSNVFALQTGTPLVAIGYLPKTRGMMEMAGLNEYVCDIDDLTFDDLRSRTFDALAHPEHFQAAQSRVGANGTYGREEFMKILRKAVATSE